MRKIFFEMISAVWLLRDSGHWIKFIVFGLMIIRGNSDVYLHNPRGSNNRLNELTRNRNNNKRLFDSQNNDRGGYNVGGLKYYVGSTLLIQWTNQHSCGSPNSNCEIILQYMCGNYVRDGTNTKTIPINNAECQNNNCSEDYSFGMNENYSYYHNCRSRQRNKGLFSADQILKGPTALYTRQNPAGTRYGFECPEERDYYPYWHPTPWKDIAVLTNNVSRCHYYQQQSENVKERYWCHLPEEFMKDKSSNLVIPVTQSECEAFTYPLNDSLGVSGVWKSHPSHGLKSPECRENEFTRDNHLGDAVGGSNPSYQWTIPDEVNQNCVLRIRYNISTADFDGWDSSINSSLNDRHGFLFLKESESILNETEQRKRGYVFKTNPQIKIFPSLDVTLNLAVDTAQYGRVFEDRSHLFSIIKRPDNVSTSAAIHNLNVRGKRGNIVQVYPAVEYDFVPKSLEMAQNDYIHIQWTGSNSNPLENDGQGLPGTDRSNIVPFEDTSFDLNMNDHDMFGLWGLNYPVQSLSNSSFLEFSVATLQSLANIDGSGDLSNLNDQGTYFNLGLEQANLIGNFYYLCTRNNDFSNREQKGRIIVSGARTHSKLIGWNGAYMKAGSASVFISEGSLSYLQNVRIEEWEEKNLKYNPQLAPYKEKLTKNLISDILIIYPEELRAVGDKTFTVSLRTHHLVSEDIAVYRSSMSDFSLWQRLEPKIKNGYTVTFDTNRGGVYLVRWQINDTVIVATVIVFVVLFIIVVGIITYFYKNRLKWKALLEKFRWTKRSLQDEL